MNVLYCGDTNIENGLIISVLSLLKNIKENLNIYVLTISLKNELYNINEVSDECIEILNNLVKEQNDANFVKKINITELVKNNLPEKNMETRFTPCCMLRLYADLIDELPEKILYLDNDVVCRLDCSEFYNQDISEFEIVGILDYYGKWFFRKNIFKFDYVNSGVLLLNLNKIKETGLFEKCRDRCKNKKMFMPDQSAINKLATSKKIVERKFNEQRKLHKDTVLQHFTTSFRAFPILHSVTIKPWQIDEVHKKLKILEYDDIFNQYNNLLELKKKEYKEVVDSE